MVQRPRIAEREDSLSFVGSESIESDVLPVAASMRRALGLDLKSAGASRRGPMRSALSSTERTNSESS